MNIFLGISAVLSWLFGVLLIFFTQQFYAPLGMEVTDKIALIASAEGAGLIGLGLINWMARNMDRSGQIAVLAGNLLTQALSLVLIVRATMMNVVTGTASGIIIHLLFGVGFAWFLIRTARNTAT